jgi:TonB-dependent SusC/RagA subfamily outer membrane receptor
VYEVRPSLATVHDSWVALSRWPGDIRLLSVALVRRITRQEEEQMRIHRSVKMGLAMGVMLVSGGCAADTLAPHPAPAPREASVVEALAGTAQGSTIQPGEAARPGARIRICRMAGHQGPGRPLVFVDGKELPHGGVHEIDPKSIESIEIVKGAAAITLYGHRAVDGVILVRTISR